jgi:EmrB/QacA subfamily drug resistance transporter
MSTNLQSPVKTEPASSPRSSLIVVVLAFSGIVVALMQTMILPISGRLPELLNAAADDTAWVVTATLLAAAVATPILGRLGDMFGKRRMLFISLVLMILGSVICALSESVTPMIIGRLVQGLALGFIPLGISIMRDVLPPAKLASSIAMMSASLGVGGAVGLPLSALVAENFDWHILFWSAAVLGAVALLLVHLVVPESDQRPGGRFDFLGAVGLSIGLVALLLAISKGGTWGWGSGGILTLFATAAVVLVLWGLYELRVKQPMVDLRTTARRQVLFTNLAGLVFGFALFAIQLIVPQIVQLPETTGFGLGGTLLQAGLVMAPQGVAMMISAPISAKISRAMGPKVTLMIGALIVAAGYGLNTFLMTEVWHLILVSCIIGVGVGLAYGAMPLLIMTGVPRSETGSANSVNSLLRAAGGSLGSAVAGVVLAQLTVTVAGHAFPSEDGFRTLMVIGCGAALVALVLAALLPRKTNEDVQVTAARSEPAVERAHQH